MMHPITSTKKVEAKLTTALKKGDLQKESSVATHYH